MNKTTPTINNERNIKRVTARLLFFICFCVEGEKRLLSVRRERAEAGELLRYVRKNMKQNSELPFNASEQDNPDHQQRGKNKKSDR